MIVADYNHTGTSYAWTRSASGYDYDVSTTTDDNVVWIYYADLEGYVEPILILQAEPIIGEPLPLLPIPDNPAIPKQYNRVKPPIRAPPDKHREINTRQH